MADAPSGATLPTLYVVIPCYNEEEVLPLTAPQFAAELAGLVARRKVSPESRIMFVNDGSADGTWEEIEHLSAEDGPFCGISLSRNRGHQNALLAGLMEAEPLCDVAISIDCDGQDDISAMEAMLDEYAMGYDVVYGVRSSRATDSAFKRLSAHAFYHLMESMGVETVFDSADYRLMSARALRGLAEFREVNLFLRGMVPLVGYRSSTVPYERHERVAGKSHYPLSKMLALALNGITSLSVKPIRIVTLVGATFALVSFAGVIWAVVGALSGSTVAGWASTVAIVCFMGGLQLIAIGIIGEYVGRIYLETKARPRWIIAERTGFDDSGKLGRQ